jgi:hypothetical protein
MFLVGLVAAAAQAVGAAGSYGSRASVEVLSYSDLDENRIAFGYTHYFTPVEDELDQPYRLQPFLQNPVCVEGVYEDGPYEASALTARGRYAVPGKPLAVTAELGFGDSWGGDGLFRLGAGVVFYVLPENRLGVEASFTKDKWEEERLGPGPPPKPVITEEIETSVTTVGARFVTPVPKTDATLEIFGGYRSTEAGDLNLDDDGLALEARYFFNKQVFAGLGFSTDTDRVSVSGGYAMRERFEAEIELGKDDALGGDFFRARVGMRF